MPGSYFNRSIIFLVNHSSDGSVGFILNKPVDFPIPEFYNEFPDYTDPIFVGGPVDIESLYFIHRYGQLIDDSVHIMGDLYWGGNFNQLKDLINKGKIVEQGTHEELSKMNDGLYSNLLKLQYDLE